MKDLWYGDRRERVKWGGLIYLAKTYKIPRILQIAYLRASGLMELRIEGEETPLPWQPEVWKHFSDLQGIHRLGEAVGVDIRVLDNIFNPVTRTEYVKTAVAELETAPRPLIVFLDPDTGISPTEKARPEHVACEDLKMIWAALEAGDVLAVYQHADRTVNWIDSRRNLLNGCLGAISQVISGKEIAGDVALLWCRKTIPLVQ